MEGPQLYSPGHNFMLGILWLRRKWILDHPVLAKGAACYSPFYSHPLDTYDGELSVTPIPVPSTARCTA